MNLRFIDWIWHIRGRLALAPEQSSDEAFDRLDPLFRQYGTSHERTDDMLTFRKKDQAAQDKMSVFDSGTLKIENGAAGRVLRYHLTSRALLFCFLAPLLFLGFAQFNMAIGKLEKPSAEAADTSKKDDKKDKVVPMNPIDKALGAPEPEKPEKDKKDSKDKKKDDDKKHSPTPAYVFAAIFATLYVIGRILEDRLVKTLFRKRLQGS
ncbi:hypothetical protein PX699_11180 [Sphingobium sp. H39-3-25]|uniref:hypothetical protein n=1 Tax=Sphingobium arseniciresistens TaxID=3030834 RepID=UPI0023B91133|nr:hypothetical protein [Sphingobium arseniciresistens]